MTTKILRVVLVFGLVCTATGCTVRYSQAMVGRIARIEGTPLINSDAGTEIGLLTPMLVIAFSEPMSVRDQQAPICEYEMVQVDYRSTWYSYYIAVNFPRIQLRSFCRVQKAAPPQGP